MTQKQLVGLCRKWQKVLRLQDWKVSVRVLRQSEMDNEGAGGEVTFNLQHQAAYVDIADVVDLEDDQLDQEFYLIHELLHLHFHPFMPEKGSPQFDGAERAINCIAEALLKLDRARKKIHLRLL